MTRSMTHAPPTALLQHPAEHLAGAPPPVIATTTKAAHGDNGTTVPASG